MSKSKNVEISLEKKLEQALIPVEEQSYKIPNNWVWTRLGEISKLSGGSGFPEKYQGFLDKNIPFYKVGNLKNIDDNFYIENSENYIDEDILNKIKAKLFFKDTIIFAKIGEAIRLNRRAILRENSCIDNNLMALVTNSSCYFRYVYYWLKKEDLYKYAQATTVPSIRQSTLEEIEFPLPPLNEQKRIVEKLDFLFNKTKKAKEIIEEIKIDIENRKISVLDRAFKGVLTSKWRNENKTTDVKELLKSINEEKVKKWEEECLQAEKEGKKKPKKPIITEVENMIVPIEEQPYNLPDSWVWVKLGDLGDYKKGPFGSSLTKSMFVEKGTDTIKVYEQKNAIQKDDKIGNYYITKNYFLEAMTGFEVKPSDIIVSCAGTVGETYILPDNAEKGIINQALMKITLTEEIEKRYYLEYFDYFLKEEAKRQSQGTAIKNIPPFKIFKDFPFPLPPLEEQQEIVRILNEVIENENKVKELLELEERIDILEKSILHKAFKGELGTQNNNDVSAMELLKEIL